MRPHAGAQRKAGPQNVDERQQPVSACVITYNRSAILGTCLRAVGFADEIIVVDKTSTDDTRAVAARLADRVVTVPWSPTVEETRAFAVSLCRHDWILLLDDDECLDPAAVRFIRQEMADPRADIYLFPLRHYILGRHDERAYYWPEHHVRLFRRGAVVFEPTVHAGMQLRSRRIMRIDPDTEPCIHHLSHPDVAGWIERTNRYTSRAQRARVESSTADLASFAHARITHWMRGAVDQPGDDYPQAVALLRAIYDMVDRLKSWEEARGTDGSALFRRICADLDAAHAAAGPIRRRRRAWLKRALMLCCAAQRQEWVLTPTPVAAPAIPAAVDAALVRAWRHLGRTATVLRRLRRAVRSPPNRREV